MGKLDGKVALITGRSEAHAKAVVDQIKADGGADI